MARTNPVINEFSFNQVGTDNFEYIEIEGAANTSYATYRLLVIEGDNNTNLGRVIYQSPFLGTTDANGLLSTSFLPANTLQNGSQTLLLVSGFTAASNQDLDTDNDGTLDVALTVLDAVAVRDEADGVAYAGAPVLVRNYDGGNQTVGGASRLPVGAADTNAPSDFVRNDFDLAGIPGFVGTPTAGEALNTPGAPNQYAVATAPVAAILVSPTGIAATEGSAAGSFTVRLATQPTADVVVPLTADAQVSLGASSLAFTPANFAAAQTVTVTAVDDAAVEGAHAGLVTTGAATSADAAYNGLNPADVSVSITDNDTAAPASVAIRAIQGAAHRSPLAGQAVSTFGIVTAVRTTGGFGSTGVAGFWLQDPRGDGSAATSEAVFVHVSSSAQLAQVAVGDAVRVGALVEEFLPGGAAGNLSITRLVNPALAVLSTGNPLPAAQVIGAGGRAIPAQVIYDDAVGNLNAGAGDFDPAAEGIDFFESLEAMRVQVNGAVVVGPTNSFNETYVLADDGAAATSRNARGGITLTEIDANPERIQVQTVPGVQPGTITADVGDRLGTVTGVVSYDFGNFELIPTAAVTVTDGGLQREVSALQGDADHLLFAEWNVENLDPSSDRFDDIAQVVGRNLNRPDIIALQEIQDGNGATNDGLTSASATAAALIAAIRTETGLTYAYADIAPIDGTSGGQPGGNIRNAFLYRPDRAALVPGSLRQVVDTEATPGVDAFASSRIPLAADFSFNGQTVTAISVHSTSKGGSTSLFGSVQPSVNGGEASRVRQATEIKDFVDRLLAANPDAKVIAAGDFNEFDYNPSQQVLLGGADPTFFDPQGLEPVEERYTYVFEGNSQALDHSLVTGALIPLIEYDAVRVTSEFASAGNISDHDPSLTRIALPATAGSAAATAAPLGTLVVEVSGTAWQGDAQFLVRIDGQQLGGVQTATAPRALGLSERLSFAGSFGDGPHRVSVEFLNDAWGGTDATDRNLFVEAVELGGTRHADATAWLYGNGEWTYAVPGTAPAAAALYLADPAHLSVLPAA